MSPRPYRGHALPLLLACVLAGSALAHPTIAGSTPRNGESLVSAPREMRITFTEPIEAAYTSVKLVDSIGNDVGSERTRADPADPKSVVVGLPTLSAGAYRARWSVLGRDGHRIKGELMFSVK